MKHGDRTKIKILEAGINAWVKDASSVTASNIARVIKMRHGTVLYHFPHGSLKKAVARYAVSIKHKKLVPILIASKNEAVLGLTHAERLEFLQVVSI